MTKWELHTSVVDISDGNQYSNPTYLWSKDKKAIRNTGEPKWNHLKELAKKGWELVSVTPIQPYSSTGTTYLLYTFKRPIEEEE